MKVSIFTATHNPIYLLDVYESIRKQKFVSRYHFQEALSLEDR